MTATATRCPVHVCRKRAFLQILLLLSSLSLPIPEAQGLPPSIQTLGMMSSGLIQYQMQA